MTKKPARILHVVARMGRGGIETWLMQVLRRVNPQEFDFHLCTTQPDPGVYEPEIRELGRTIVRCYLPESRLTFCRRLAAVIAQGQYDIVHSHTGFFGGLVLRSAAKAGVPIRIAHFHSTRSYSQGRMASRLGPLYPHLMRYLVRHYATHVLANSRASMKVAIGPRWFEDPRGQVLYYGTDLTRFEGGADREGVRNALGIPASAPIALHVGSFRTPKNHQLLVEIAAELARLTPELHWCLVGGGTLKTAIEGAVKDRNLESRVHFLGERDDVPHLMKASDVFVFPSLWEGFGIVLLEARAAGLSIVASDIEGIQEAVENCPTAKLIGLSSNVSEWARAVQDALSHPVANKAEVLSRLKQTPFANVDKSVELLCSIYQDAMGKNSHQQAY